LIQNNLKKPIFSLLTHAAIPAATLKTAWKTSNQNVGLMPEQHVKTDTEISHSTDSQHYGQHQHIVMQHLLHEGSWRAPNLG